MGDNQHEPGYRYCPVCGGALTQQQLKPSEPFRLVCSTCEFVFYVDPKVVACTVLEMDGRVLLLKRGIDPQKGKWVMPGGYVDRGEPVPSAAIRETEEECGLKTRLLGLIGVYSYPGRPAVVVVYRGRYLSGELTAADETQDARWFEPEQIPWDELAFQSTHDALTDYLKDR